MFCLNKVITLKIRIKKGENQQRLSPFLKLTMYYAIRLKLQKHLVSNF
ncbi:hypothetical protein CLU83_3244 [Flavobacterium sp. 1]|nr:hypothetical protein CLU83_3244 [Flavobacterium sp. 1]